MALTEWFTDNYTNYGAQLEFVSDRSQEGSQFVKGFGGVGAILRFQLDVSTLDYEEEYKSFCGTMLSSSDDEEYYDD